MTKYALIDGKYPYIINVLEDDETNPRDWDVQTKFCLKSTRNFNSYYINDVDGLEEAYAQIIGEFGISDKQVKDYIANELNITDWYDSEPAELLSQYCGWNPVHIQDIVTKMDTDNILLVMPVYLYDHGGICFTRDRVDRFDSTFLGWQLGIYNKEEYKQRKEEIFSAFETELKYASAYYNGSLLAVEVSHWDFDNGEWNSYNEVCAGGFLDEDEAVQFAREEMGWGEDVKLYDEGEEPWAIHTRRELEINKDDSYRDGGIRQRILHGYIVAYPYYDSVNELDGICLEYIDDDKGEFVSNPQVTMTASDNIRDDVQVRVWSDRTREDYTKEFYFKHRKE